MTSHVLKQSENVLPPVLPVLKSKSRILSTVTNKDVKARDVNKVGGKTALQRQRANASKLSCGLSVVARVDKENECAFKKPAEVIGKVAQKPQKKLAESKTTNLKKSDSIISIYQPEKVKEKEKIAGISKLDGRVTRMKNALANKEPIVRPITKAIEETKKVEEKIIIKEPEKEVPKNDEKEVIPLGVNIIDEDDDAQNSEFILGVYAKDIYDFLRHLEKVQGIRKNYLTPAHIMTQNMRSVLIDWVFEVQQIFRLLNETIQLAIGLLDRFMQDHPSIAKDELQLVTVACIFLASKYEEIYPPDLEDLVEITAKAYTKHQVLKMEQTIFSSLNFQMGHPLPSQFLRRYGRAGNVDFVTYCFSKYFIDLSLVNYSLCHVKPSLLAAASLYLASYLTHDDLAAKIWTPTLEYYSQYPEDTLKPIVSKIASIVLEVPKSNFQNVKRKYHDAKRLHDVSSRAELSSEKLIKIAKESESLF